MGLKEDILKLLNGSTEEEEGTSAEGAFTQEQMDKAVADAVAKFEQESKAPKTFTQAEIDAAITKAIEAAGGERGTETKTQPEPTPIRGAAAPPTKQARGLTEASILAMDNKEVNKQWEAGTLQKYLEAQEA